MLGISYDLFDMQGHALGQQANQIQSVSLLQNIAKSFLHQGQQEDNAVAAMQLLMISIRVPKITH